MPALVPARALRRSSVDWELPEILEGSRGAASPWKEGAQQDPWVAAYLEPAEGGQLKISGCLLSAC